MAEKPFLFLNLFLNSRKFRAKKHTLSQKDNNSILYDEKR